ncbi:hypothetical protein TBLA_0B09130 [Henningerozyma blattae CBS 6284]|uniref:AB hydrolase-1 domain-containing protein n=1 Tax=Henningerozyma blattae (strain ATCC 34711 / CBS 6284 / DSM 70876 / NBRC 10599 / NRRL Y-10934 / UCD 77-7) TaxID=1071380 RepID=I2H026_HENB6|nr:hypothetical protein TBLA_0B09130 [Tetrapisispora blattae CBS 6284]CCH59728.1 hypothetical protein TBLA_0B09130 [Tetrapisispora blattae CBS 6284]
MFFIGRLSITDYCIIILVYIESTLSFLANLVPHTILNITSFIVRLFLHITGTRTWLTSISSPSTIYGDSDDDEETKYEKEKLRRKKLRKFEKTNVDQSEKPIEQKLQECPDIHSMCKIFDIEIEDHLVRTEDNYILTLHRIRPSPEVANGKVAYLHHGLLMCSDVWVCNIDRSKNLPFVLHDLGYDVWLGNNRGNKYSTAHLHYLPKERRFWDFSIDEFAFFDIPNSIEFVLKSCNIDQLICIGFSQGSAQMFAALSVNESLNSKISQFIAIAPAMTPKRLHNPLVDTLVKSSPNLMYLFFGHNIIYPSAVIWRRTLHPKLFNLGVDTGNKLLFNWHALNITEKQKLVSYNKLYSTTSVKSIVHWFQILRSQKFQMYEESDDMFNSLSKPYQIPVFPTKTNIKVPILLLYGGQDSLVDIEVMKKNLPKEAVFDVNIKEHEHLDLIWGNDVDKLVIPKIVKFIDFFSNINNSNLDHKIQRSLLLKNSNLNTISHSISQYESNSNTNSTTTLGKNNINHIILNKQPQPVSDMTQTEELLESELLIPFESRTDNDKEIDDYYYKDASETIDATSDKTYHLSKKQSNSIISSSPNSYSLRKVSSKPHSNTHSHRHKFSMDSIGEEQYSNDKLQHSVDVNASDDHDTISLNIKANMDELNIEDILSKE